MGGQAHGDHRAFRALSAPQRHPRARFDTRGDRVPQGAGVIVLTPHGHGDAPSPWVARWAGLIAPGGTALDVAAGRGRHAQLLAARGLRVEAIDRDAQALTALAAIAGVTPIAADIESGPWPCAGRAYDGVVVTNYLWRERLPDIAAAVGDGGILIYETFADGNEMLGKPSNPSFLLRRGELLDWARTAALTVLGFESGRVQSPRPAIVERICAWRAGGSAIPPAID